ncbi:hypothetical protein R3P38DRAFT_2799646 [Favolaschia claudopus]|uniref:Uncharacterized protein n=1 Tax=Favolaschia claudopus TaxID=2862362 RepID=A0AAV9ZZU5_9AGAR
MLFKVFWWKAYVAAVKKEWEEEEIGVEEDHDGETDQGKDAEKVVLMRSKSGYVGTTTTDDYIFRSDALENTSLFDFIQMAQRVKRTAAEEAEFARNIEQSSPDPTAMEVQDPSWIVEDLTKEDNARYVDTDERDGSDSEEDAEDYGEEIAEFHSQLEAGAVEYVVKGPKQLAKEKQMSETERVMSRIKWTAVLATNSRKFERRNTGKEIQERTYTEKTTKD